MKRILLAADAFAALPVLEADTLDGFPGSMRYLTAGF